VWQIDRQTDRTAVRNSAVSRSALKTIESGIIYGVVHCLNAIDVPFSDRDSVTIEFHHLPSSSPSDATWTMSPSNIWCMYAWVTGGRRVHTLNPERDTPNPRRAARIAMRVAWECHDECWVMASLYDDWLLTDVEFLMTDVAPRHISGVQTWPSNLHFKHLYAI